MRLGFVTEPLRPDALMIDKNPANGQQPSPETIDFIWDETRGAVDAQLRLVERLDSKAFQSIGVGSALIGLTVLGSGALLAAPPPGRWFVALALAVFFYVLSALFTFLTVNIRRYRHGSRADELWPTMWQENPIAIKHALVADWAESYRHNKGELGRKACFLRAALATMALEAMMIGIAVAWAAWRAST